MATETRQLRATLALFALLALLPWAVLQPYWQGVLIVALYYAALAVAWNLLAGYGGQFSLAPAAFSLLGGYTTGVLHYHAHLSPLVGIPASVVVTFVVGDLLGRIVLKMRGPYLALTTFAFLAIVNLVIANSYAVTRGDLALSVPALPLTRPQYYYLSVLLLAAVQCVTYGPSAPAGGSSAGPFGTTSSLRPPAGWTWSGGRPGCLPSRAPCPGARGPSTCTSADWRARRWGRSSNRASSSAWPSSGDSGRSPVPSWARSSWKRGRRPSARWACGTCWCSPRS